MRLCRYLSAANSACSARSSAAGRKFPAAAPHRPPTPALLRPHSAPQRLCAFVVLFLPPIRLVRPVPRPPAANSRKHPTSAAKAVLHPDKPLAKCLIPLLFVRSGNVRADCVGLTRSDPLPNDTLQLVPF